MPLQGRVGSSHQTKKRPSGRFLKSYFAASTTFANTSGLLLLTNDSRWSRRLMSPEEKVDKVYQVTLQNELTEEYISAFAVGMYFEFENITTQPAQLTILSPHLAEVV